MQDEKGPAMNERDDYMQAQDAHHDMLAMRDPDRDVTRVNPTRKAAERHVRVESALREYLDWHEVNFALPSGNFEDPDQHELAKEARAALEAVEQARKF